MRNAFKLFSIVALFSVMSCGGDNEPAIVPTVNYTQSTLVIEVGHEVRFNSTVTNATSLLWEFGDGTTSTDPNPTHVYSETGPFTITLTVTSSTGHTANRSTTIGVGVRWMEGFTISSIPFTDENGAPWDADSGPDMFLSLAPASQTDMLQVDMGSDLSEADFPYGDALDGADQRELTNEEWVFRFIDNDAPFNDLNTSQVISDFRFNPATTPAWTFDFYKGIGSFDIESNGFVLSIHYIIR